MNRQVIALICVFLSACAHQQAPPPVAQIPTETELVCSEKMVGVNPLANEQTVKEKYRCHKNALPFLVIERHELFPPVPQAGQEFKHCFIYSVCASDPPTPAPIKATLSRKIFFRGKPLFKDNSNVVIKPGKWADAAVIKTPPGTKPGDYSFQVSFSIPGTTTSKDLPFVIRK